MKKYYERSRVKEIEDTAFEVGYHIGQWSEHYRIINLLKDKEALGETPSILQVIEIIRESRD